MMPKYIALTLAIIFSSSFADEKNYTIQFAESHSRAFPSIKENFLYYTPDDQKKLIQSVELKIDESTELGTCGFKSMYSMSENGHPVIVICPYGYRILQEFVEGAAFFSMHMGNLIVHTENAEDVERIGGKYSNFLQSYNNYLRDMDRKSIATNTRKEMKLCIPLIYLYLYLHNIDPSECKSETINYATITSQWAYDRHDGLLNDELLKSIGAAPEMIDNLDKKRVLKETKDTARMATWQGLIYHEFYHILKGDINHRAKSQEEAAEREVQADIFALKMISFTTKEPPLKATKTGYFLTVQAYTASISNEESFKPRISNTFSTIAPLLSNPKIKNGFPPELLEKITRVMRSNCDTFNCAEIMKASATKND